MAETAVSFLLEKVEQILTYNVTLVTGAEHELHQLKDELALLKSFLEDAKRKQKKDKTFRELERQIRYVVYEAEDTIDTRITAATEAVGKKSFNPFRRAKKAIYLPGKVNMAEEVKYLRDKVKPTIDLLQMHNGNGSGTITEQLSTRVKKVPLLREDNAVGFQDEEETLIKYIMDQSVEQLDVISIIGMPGLGKTTLAWKIYQNSEIRFQFPVRIWVYVSQEFNVRDVLLNILKVFTNSRHMSSLSEFELAHIVRSCLENAKFLLVMDDVWTVEAWNKIKHVLPINNWMGKVLITSRHENVGIYANVTRNPHMLRFLNEDESWELLQLEVFGKQLCPPELEPMGKYIAKQCDGLPLAIVTIGGILVDLYTRNRDMDEIIHVWEDVSRNLRSYVKYNNDDNSISDIVALSYNNLSDDLRECFLYLGIFPEDYEIPVWTLTRLWIAEGFILDQGQGLEKTAEDNLNDLINRNLVMVGETTPNGQLKTCRVHDVIREYCISKAAPNEQNIFQEIKMSAKLGVFVPSVSDIQKYRRLCVHSHLSDFLDALAAGVKGGHVRSLLCFCKEPIVLEGAYISTIPDSFNLLRVLDSKSFKFDQFPIKVTKLVHLRYITLSWDDLDVLPQDISKLWNLQTLVVETESPTLRLEADIWKMIQLRHLKTKATIILAAKSEGKGGENLQTLSNLSPDDCTQEVFTKARNLKKLGIRGHLDTLSNSTSLAKLDHLENLKLMNDMKAYSTSERQIRSLPASKHFPPNIKRLTLSATYLGWAHMSILGEIPTLQVLKLKENAFTGYSWTVDGGFPSLQFLLIATTDLETWKASDDHFPSLTCLVLKNCENLSEIPLGLAKSLQILDIERDIPKSAIESARKIMEEKENMQGAENLRRGEFKLTIGPGCE